MISNFEVFYFMKIVKLFIITIIFLSNIFAQQNSFIPLDRRNVPVYIEEIHITGTDQIFSNIEQIIQTKDSHIWLATNRGLAKYNGINFDVYNNFNVKEFKSPSTLSLLEDNDGTLWIGTREGLLMMKNNVFSRYNDSTLGSISIVKMCKDDRGNIYLGTLNKGLFRINPDKSLYKYPEPLEESTIFTLLYSDSVLWIGANKQGLIKLKNEKFEYLNNISPYFSYEMRSSCKDKDGNYWFGTDRNGLIKYSNNTIKHYTIKDGLTSNRIYAIAENNDGSSLVVGTYGGGLTKKMDNNNFSSYANMDNNGLTLDAVRSLYYDKEGNLWIGLLGGGLNVLRQKNLLSYNMRQHLNDNYIWTINKDLSGNIWIGTNSNGINVITKNKLISYKNDYHPYCMNIRTITNDSKGRHWIGTYNRGIILVDNNNKTNYSKTEGTFVSDTIESIYEDSKGTIWIGSWGPLAIYQDGKIQFPRFPDNEQITRVHYIKEDHEHNYWFATRYGIFKYSQNKLISYTKEKDGILSNFIYSFFLNKDSSMLICTRQGLLRYKDENFLHIKFGNAFNNSDIIEIIEDDIGNYWVTSFIGILVFKKEDLEKFVNGKIDFIPNRILGKADGILSTDFSGGNQNTCTKGPDGRLWFTSTNGIVVADPEKVFKQINNVPPEICITKFIANDSLIDTSSDKIKIPANPKNIIISYAALSYKNPLLNKYKYRLIGFDDYWIEAENMNMAHYSTLSPGTYTFQVIASNSDLVWNTNGIQLTFTVLPKFYQTTAFAVLMPLFILVVLYYTYKFRVNSLEKNKIKLQRLVNEQTATLQHEIKQRKKNEEELLNMRKVESLSILSGGIAHDFNNLLTAILGNISLLKYKLLKEDTKDLIKLVESSEKASLKAKSLTQQLLTFSKEGKLSLKNVSIGNLLEECTIFTLRGSSAKGVFDIADNLWPVDADEGQLIRVFQNLIINAIQAMHNGGNIYITAKNVTLDSNDPIAIETKSPDHVKISIIDTGSGISEENMHRLFEPYFTTKKTGHGLGLASCFNIIKQHKGYINAKSQLGIGTEFIIFLPRTDRTEED